MEKKVRTRIAPSPTGAPHIGTAYIALHNMAFAKSQGGEFILRIEDTDRVRSSTESEDEILSALKWLNLDWSEGPDCGGPHGPYRQSERLDIYKKHCDDLITSGHAYHCFCNKERLADLRKTQMENKETLGYDGHCRSLSSEEVKKNLDTNSESVVRLKVEKEGVTSFFDEVRQQNIEFQNSEVDDQVLLKADGFPTYHLANVVDDHLMEISHVLRGEEWISSTPKHVMLYEAFGWEKPVFMHLPLLRNHDKSKISKRKNPTSLQWFMAAGYARESIVNFLGLMGYSLGNDQEIFSIEELQNQYDAKRISATAPVFDFVKLDTLNSHYLNKMDSANYLNYLSASYESLLTFVGPLLPLIKERVRTRSDLNKWTDFLFEREFDFDISQFKVKKCDQAKAQKYLKACAKALTKERPTGMDDFKTSLKNVAESQELHLSPAFMLIRIACLKKQESLPLFEVLEFYGYDLAVKRIKDASQYINANWPK